MHLSSKTQPPKNGYIPLKEYVAYLDAFTEQTGWKLPLRIMDKIQLWFLKKVVTWSWFGDRLFIEEFSTYGLGYDQVFNYIDTQLFSITMQRQWSTLTTLPYYHWRLFHKSTSGKPEAFALGTDSDYHLAISKAFGEGLERYFTLLAKERDIKTDRISSVATLRAAGYMFYYPPEYHTFSDEQLKQTPFLYNEHDQKLEWVKAKRADTHKMVYVPKQLISRQCQKLLIPKEGMLYQHTTNGSAGWFTKAGATYRAVFELIQRDAFMQLWLKREAAPAIDIETIEDQTVQTLITHIRAAKTEVILLKPDAAADVPTVIALVVDQALQDERIYVTAHTDVTIEKAILGALQESLVFFSEKPALTLPDMYTPFITRGIGRKERLGLYIGTNQVKPIRALHSGAYISLAAAQSGDFLEQEDVSVLNTLTSRLTVLGETFVPLVYTYEHKVLKKIGFYVVKCFIPALFPLYLTEHMATLRSVRLGTYQETSYIEVVKKINTSPHPFP